MSRKLLIDDMLDDLDSYQLETSDLRDVVELDIVSLWDIVERNIIYAEPSEKVRHSNKRVASQKLDPTAEARRKRAAYHRDPEATRKRERERKQAYRLRLQA